MSKSPETFRNIQIYDNVNDFERNLPKTVEVIETNSADKIYVIGTAHFSRESQDDVSYVMRNSSPQGVMLELCPLRLHILKYDEKTLLDEAAKLSPARIREIIAEHGVATGMFYVRFLNVSADITKQLGMAPGGECRRAVAEAKVLSDCKVFLGDRPINITLKRAMGGMGILQVLKLTMDMKNQKTTITQEDVERLKERRDNTMDEFKDNLPSIHRAFVTERDYILAHSLALSVKTLKDIHGQSKPVRLVGVIGMGHMNGVLKNYGKTTDQQVMKYMKMPKGKWLPSLRDGTIMSKYNYTKLFMNSLRIAR